MKKILVLVFVLFAIPSYAQYNPAKPDSGQCHWTINGNIQHTHNDNVFNRYGTISGPVKIDFTHTLFHTTAQIGQYYVGNQKTSDAQNTLFWNDTNSSTQPIEIGDPAGVKTWSGNFTLTPNVKHGWGKINSSIYTYFPDGSTTVTELFEPYHSILDPSVPEVLTNQDQLISANCRVNSPKSGNNTYGNQTVSLENVLPNAPISSPFTIMFGTYNYANAFTAQEPAVSDVILDADFHNGINGTTLFSTSTVGDFVHGTTVLDPTKMGPAGDHKIIIRRTQPNKGDSLATLLVFHVVTSTGGPVPPVCTPPSVLVNGSCVDPTPPSFVVLNEQLIPIQKSDGTKWVCIQENPLQCVGPTVPVK